LEVLPGARCHIKIGNAKGLILSMADDFDEPLDDFKDCMKIGYGFNSRIQGLRDSGIG
jgi:hypothetical protein